LQLDQVPDVAEGGFDDGGLEDRGGGRDARHGCGEREADVGLID
jgi:hypothetical protein